MFIIILLLCHLPDDKINNMINWIIIDYFSFIARIQLLKIMINCHNQRSKLWLDACPNSPPLQELFFQSLIWQDVFLKCHWLVLSKGFPESAFTINLSLFLALPYQSTVLSYPMPSLNGSGVSVYTTKLKLLH